MFLVLVPGFEPGSTDRESDMMDRTTPHERQSIERRPLFKRLHTPDKSNFTFTFTIVSFPSLNIQMNRDHFMMSRKATHTGLRYRKRPKPHRVVPLASLNRTEARSKIVNTTSIVDNSGNISDNQNWQPLRARTAFIEISPSSWSGLHSRMMATLPLKVEAS